MSVIKTGCIDLGEKNAVYSELKNKHKCEQDSSKSISKTLELHGNNWKMQTERDFFILFYLDVCTNGFTVGSMVKNPPANTRDTDSISGLGRSHTL